MKPLVCIIGFFCFFSTTVHGQHLAVLSMNSLNGNKTGVLSSDVLSTPDKGVIIKISGDYSATANYKISCITSSSNNESLFQKYDSTGINLLWERCYGSGAGEIISWLFPLPSGAFILGGIGPVGGNSGWIIRKESASGNILWTKGYDASGGSIHTMAASGDGGYFIVGHVTNGGGDVGSHYGSTMTDDIWALKLDSNGNKLWAKVIGGSYDDDPSKVIATPDGGCYIVGSTLSNDFDCTGLHNLANLYNDLYIVRLDAAGNIKWHRCLGGSNGDGAIDALLTSSNGLLIAGSTRSNDSDIHHHIGPSGNLDYWILTTDSTGAIVWENCLGTSSRDEYPAAISRSADGSIWTIGTSYVKDGQVDTAYGQWDAWITKSDTAGNLVSARVLGSTHRDEGYLVHALNDGTVLAGGHYYDAGNTGLMPTIFTGADTFFYHNIFLTKLAPWTTGITPVTKPSANVLLKAYPNPAGNVMNIDIMLPDAEKGSFYLADVNGKMLGTPVVVSGNVHKQLDVSAWSRGTYMVIYENKQGEHITTKVVLQ